MPDVSAARDGAVLAALSELEAALPGTSAALVTRGGGILAGKGPSPGGRELYGAMAATMFGAAEAGTLEFGQDLLEVEARLKGGALVAVAAGRKLVLVVHVNGVAPPEDARGRIHDCARKLAALF
ncbi:MAG TPA: roadblock/LC7 domain-containing protein [Candidatus Thermoplasmatota archaeon]|nr:roadblock/LC7 domain-containing protein [Candidatus Thermoplasmatota archaeon]